MEAVYQLASQVQNPPFGREGDKWLRRVGNTRY